MASAPVSANTANAAVRMAWPAFVSRGRAPPRPGLGLAHAFPLVHALALLPVHAPGSLTAPAASVPVPVRRGVRGQGLVEFSGERERLWRPRSRGISFYYSQHIGTENSPVGTVGPLPGADRQVPPRPGSGALPEPGLGAGVPELAARTAPVSSPASPCPPPATAGRPWPESTPGWGAGACSPPGTWWTAATPPWSARNGPAASIGSPSPGRCPATAPAAPRPGGLRPRRLPRRL